ncbi:hypothetical protein VTO73DRAFT_3596 [Trametes versicolor]
MIYLSNYRRDQSLEDQYKDHIPGIPGHHTENPHERLGAGHIGIEAWQISEHILACLVRAQLREDSRTEHEGVWAVMRHQRQED